MKIFICTSYISHVDKAVIVGLTALYFALSRLRMVQFISNNLACAVIYTSASRYFREETLSSIFIVVLMIFRIISVKSITDVLLYSLHCK